ncbi:MAG: hypothetical protein ACJ71Q_03040 [Terriglobales bacterium]
MMCPACLTPVLGTVAGSAGGAGVFAWLTLHHRLAKQQAEPPSATFQEWVDALLSEKEAPQEPAKSAAVFIQREPPTHPTIGA